MRFIAYLLPVLACAAITVAVPSTGDVTTAAATRIPFKDRTTTTTTPPLTTPAGRIPLKDCTPSALPSASPSNTPTILKGTSYRSSYWVTSRLPKAFR
ncbi:hypothetical protein JCM11641_001240 [Rhodosporidiobolus odoratus]